jgi:Response regulator containing a CheY-like receiver domain and a GGDEF domain
MKFLIVDDSPTMLRIIRNALQEIGYDDIVEAEDGEDALEKLEENAPDFVVTDWNMPNMNGVDLTSNIRNHPEYSDLPILMITTRGMKEDVKTAMKAEVNNYIVKPFEPEVLEEKVDSCLERLRRRLRAPLSLSRT